MHVCTSSVFSPLEAPLTKTNSLCVLDIFNIITYYEKSWTRIAEQSKASICVYKAYTINFF